MRNACALRRMASRKLLEEKKNEKVNDDLCFSIAYVA